MRYLISIRSAENQFGPPPPALMAAIAALGQEAAQAGVLAETGGLLPSAMGAIVSLRGGKIVTLDGPFTETKELVGGYAIYEVASKAEAIEWTQRFMAAHRDNWPGWEGESEIRQIMTFAPL